MKRPDRSFSRCLISRPVRVAMCFGMLIARLGQGNAAQTNLYYVNLANAGNAEPPYTSWGTAATNLFDAVVQAEADINPEVGIFSDVVVADGVYVVTNQLVITKPIRLYSHSGDPATTALSGSYPARQHRVLHVTGEAWVSGFTISNGYASGYSPDNYGGGVFMTTNGLGKAGILSDCHVVGNQARQAPDAGYAYGCGIHLNRGGTVSSCLIQANTSNRAWGGGVFCNYGGRVEHCTIIANNCSTAATTHGGGIFLNRGGFVTNCYFERNVVREARGMGVTLYYGGEVVDCTFTKHNSGPAIRFEQSGGRASYCILTNNYGGVHFEYNGILEHSIIHNNTGYGISATRDSQIYNCIVSSNNGRGMSGDWRMIVRNTLVYGNVSTADGGGVKGGTLENCTIVRNQAAQGGGVSSIANSKNLIVYDNFATVESNNYYKVGGISYSCTTPLIPGTGNIAADPLFYRTGSGYGRDAVPGDWRLRASSPCRDTGVYASWMANDVDVRGQPRILPEAGGTVDMGAYENTAVPMSTLLIVN